jgi:hypothetical protein
MTFSSQEAMDDYVAMITAVVRCRLHADPRTRDIPREQLDRAIELEVCKTVYAGLTAAWLEAPIGGHPH